MVEVFGLAPCRCLLLSPLESRDIARSRSGISSVSVNLGLGRAKVEVVGGEALIELNGSRLSVDVDLLEWHLRRRSVLAIDGEKVYEVEFRAPDSYYKLVPLERGPPTLEINGIHMHRVSGTDPLSDASLKVSLAKDSRGDRVLEIGTGLGYTTIESLKRGAAEIITVEANEPVLWIAERNPWSWGISSPRVKVLLGDACSLLDELDFTFDKVIHDPPRLTPGTSCLYSVDFYRSLYRLLRPGGVLFHYTGEPGRVHGFSLPSKVARNLREVGFTSIKYYKNAMGVVGVKPKH